jgi:hypothetical protein
MTRLQKTAITANLAATLALGAGPRFWAAQVSPTPGGVVGAKTTPPIVIPNPGLSAKNLLAASREAADSSRDNAALRNDNSLGIFQLQSYATSGTDAKACQLMPTSELEAAYGGKPTNPHGFDGDSSVCTVNIHGVAIKLQSALPGAAGVPTSVRQGLAGARMMLGAAKQSAGTKTRDFGKVGCMNLKMTKGFDGKALARPLLTTSCFLVEGGYLNMSVSGENAKQVGFEQVKAFLEKAAARR